MCLYNEPTRRVLFIFQPVVLGLPGKVLAVGGYRGGFCEKLPEASSMSDRIIASSKIDTPLAKVESISHGSSTSVLTYLRRGKKKPDAPTAAKRKE